MRASFNKWDGKTWHVRVDGDLNSKHASLTGTTVPVRTRDGGSKSVRLGERVTSFNARTSIYRIAPEFKRVRKDHGFREDHGLATDKQRRFAASLLKKAGLTASVPADALKTETSRMIDALIRVTGTKPLSSRWTAPSRVK